MSTGDNIKQVHRKAALQISTITIQVYTKGVEFDVHVKSDTAFVHAFVPVSHHHKAEKDKQLLASQPVGVQEEVLTTLLFHPEEVKP